jgi:hypothetical protein
MLISFLIHTQYKVEQVGESLFIEREGRINEGLSKSFKCAGRSDSSFWRYLVPRKAYGAPHCFRIESRETKKGLRKPQGSQNTAC